MVPCIHTYIHIYIILYTYTVSATAILFLPLIQSCLHLPLPHLGPFQVPRQLLAHHKQKYNLQVGVGQCKLYVCNAFNFDAACVVQLVCIGIVGNDGGLFVHHHSQCDVLWSCVLFLSVILLIPMHMHMYTVMLGSIVYCTSSAVLNIIPKISVF